MTRLTARHRPDVADSDLGRIAYQVTPPAKYYEAADGYRWRVYDCRVENGWLRRVGLDHPAASSRVFVGPPARDAQTGHAGYGSVRKCYRFKKGERRELTPSILERQLRESEFLGTSGKFNSGQVTAR